MSNISQWIRLLEKESDFTVSFIPFTESKEWILDKNEISHKTGGFFKIIGIKWKNSYQPLIDQREIGTLGFLMIKNKNRVEFLIQAKIEPGNVNIIQLAPTYQATASNSFRLHGGKKTPFSNLFLKPKDPIIFESLQSEQGTKFYQKQNKNMLIEVKNKPIQSKYYKWVNIDDLLELLKKDFLINTDARSVLVCSPWRKIIGRKPFTRYKNAFSEELHKSYYIPPDKTKIDTLIKIIFERRKRLYSPTIVPLKKLEGWEISNNEIKSIKKNVYSIKQLKVKTKGREVPEWDQPIVVSKMNQSIILICQLKNEVLQFGFSFQIEPGLHNLIELGPTYIGDRESRKIEEEIIISSKQSEEGGRFYQNINNYKIVKVNSNKNKDSSSLIWLTVSEIENLLKLDGIFTNEARSAISLILSYL